MNYITHNYTRVCHAISPNAFFGHTHSTCYDQWSLTTHLPSLNFVFSLSSRPLKFISLQIPAAEHGRPAWSGPGTVFPGGS